MFNLLDVISLKNASFPSSRSYLMPKAHQLVMGFCAHLPITTHVGFFFSNWSLYRPCVCCYNSFEFICVITLLYLENIPLLLLTTSGSYCLPTTSSTKIPDLQEVFDIYVPLKAEYSTFSYSLHDNKFEIVLVRIFIAVKSHHDTSNSYKEKI